MNSFSVQTKGLPKLLYRINESFKNDRLPPINIDIIGIDSS